MKTIPLEEVLKLATKSKLFVDRWRQICDDHEARIADCDLASSIDQDATAALLAHSWNIRDELIEALEKSLDRQYDPQNPAKNSDLRAVLQRAREVEMP